MSLFWVYVCVVVELLSLALADTPSLRRCVRELVLSAAAFLRFFGDLLAAGAGVARCWLGYFALSDTPPVGRCARELHLTAVDFLRFFGDLMEVGADVARHLLGVVEGGGFAERVTGWLLIFGAVCSAYSAVLLCQLLMMYGFVILSKWVRFVAVCSVVPMEGFEVCAR